MSGDPARETPEQPAEEAPSATGHRRGPGTYDRRQTTEERRYEQRRSLISAGAKVFARDGYANASVAAVLEASLLSRGTYYRHFSDLRELFLAVQEESSSALYRTVETAFLSEVNPPEQMRAAITAYLEFLGRHGDLSRVFHREARVCGEEYATLRRKNLDAIAGLFERGLRQALELGLINEMPDELTLHALVVAIEGVGGRYLERHDERRATEAAKPLVRLCFKAFA